MMIDRRRLLAAGAGLATCVAAAHAQSPASADGESEEYRLGAGDQLRITVFGEDALTGAYVVNARGRVAFPLLGEIEAGGLTLGELTEAMTRDLGARFLVNPNVSIEVANYRPFFILGEVQNPGTYPYATNLTVMNAVATAGGFTYRANTRRVWIKHADQTQERAYRLTPTMLVRPGDTVRIAERIF